MSKTKEKEVSKINGIICIVTFLIVLFFVILANIPSNKSLYNNMINSTVLLTNVDGFGSGVFIDDNIILTAGHCLTENNEITVVLINGKILHSKEIYVDDIEDIGFVVIEADELAISKLSSVQGKIGDTVYLVGSPYDDRLQGTVTKGIISNLDRDMYDHQDLIQTDAEGAPGSSGCPLYDENGKIIGICVAGPNPGGGVTLCEGLKDIKDAYKRFLERK